MPDLMQLANFPFCKNFHPLESFWQDDVVSLVMKLDYNHQHNNRMSSSSREKLTSVWISLVGVALVAGVLFHRGESAPHPQRQRDPSSWNFLIKKEQPLPVVIPTRPDKGDSLRIPPVDFLLKKPSHYANSRSRPGYRDDESDEYDTDPGHQYDPSFKRPRRPSPTKPQPWLKSTLTTGKRAVTNYYKAVRKMFKPDSVDKDRDDYHVQERGDHKTQTGNGGKPLKTKKYGTNLELDGGNRVKSVSMIMGQDGDPFTEPGYLRGGTGSEEEDNLGIGEAISELFWGSVYGGQ